jgi:S1-C subfamily serine protease
LNREPSKASAWTAGIVGALLASGLVLVGTHLAAALTSPTSHQTSKALTAPVLGAEAGINANEQAGFNLSPGMSSAVSSVAKSMVNIQANFGAKPSYVDGLIISQNGLIVAPATSVAGTTSIIVTLNNQVSYVGTVIGIDNGRPYNSDIALIQINAKGLQPAPLDTQEPTSNHQIVLALNVQSGNEQVIATTINALDSPQTGHLYQQLIDSIVLSPTPQKLIPGTAILDDTGGVVAFVVGSNKTYPVAIPSWLIKPVVNVIAIHKTPLKGWLGVVATNYTLGRGVLIDTVYPHSAAAQYGILPGDVIISIDGQPTDTVNSLMAHLYTKPPGSSVSMVVIRDNRMLTIKPVLGSSVGVK